MSTDIETIENSFSSSPTQVLVCGIEVSGRCPLGNALEFLAFHVSPTDKGAFADFSLALARRFVVGVFPRKISSEVLPEERCDLGCLRVADADAVG